MLVDERFPVRCGFAAGETGASIAATTELYIMAGRCDGCYWGQTGQRHWHWYGLAHRFACMQKHADSLTLYSISVWNYRSGCGASCIYPLLAARKNAWRMYAVDIDDDSIKCARDNVRRNQLDDRITVIAANRDSDPFAVLLNDKRWSSIVADFTMCNPPFFEEPNLLDDGNDGAAKWTAERRGNRTGKRAQPSAASTGCEHELATGGGEIAFVTKMIRDGTELGNRVTVFTTMLGHKRSLLAIEAALKAHGIANYCTTAFCQGRTMRWAVAWTMRSDVQLRKVPSLGPVKAVARKKPLSFDVTECGSIADAHRRLCAILAALDGVILTEETVDADTVACRVVAHRNSWSRQRQKRRAERKCMDDASDGGQPPQMLCGEGTAGDADAAAASQVILEVLLAIRRVFCSRLELQLDYLAGQAGPNGAYQLLQFLINKWKDG